MWCDLREEGFGDGDGRSGITVIFLCHVWVWYMGVSNLGGEGDRGREEGRVVVGSEGGGHGCLGSGSWCCGVCVLC